MADTTATSGSTSWWSPEVLKTLGLPTVLCCVMMWLGSKEIEKASARLDRLTDFVLSSLIEQSKKSTAALENNTAVLQLIHEDLKGHEDARRSAIPAAPDGGGT